MPSWIGPWEIAIILVLILLIFGPRKLPELGSSLGKSIRGFRKGLKGDQDGGDTVSAEEPSAVAEARADAPADETTAASSTEQPAKTDGTEAD